MKASKLKFLAAAIASAMMLSLASVSASAWLEGLPDASTSAPEPDTPDEFEDEEEEEDEEGYAPDSGNNDATDITLPAVTTSPESDAPDEEASETAPAIVVPADTTTAEQITYESMNEFTMYVNESINVRVGPGTGYNIFGGLTAGDSVQVVGKNGEWYAIKFLGGTGFVKNNLLSQTPAATTTTAATTAATAPPAAENTTTTTPAEATVIEPDDTAVLPPDSDSEDEADNMIPAADEDLNIEDDSDENTDNSPADIIDNTEEDKKPAASVKTDGISAFLIALGGAALIFFLVGLLPILIHKIHHNKLYQY